MCSNLVLGNGGLGLWGKLLFGCAVFYWEKLTDAGKGTVYPVLCPCVVCLDGIVFHCVLLIGVQSGSSGLFITTLSFNRMVASSMGIMLPNDLLKASRSKHRLVLVMEACMVVVGMVQQAPVGEISRIIHIVVKVCHCNYVSTFCQYNASRLRVRALAYHC